MLGANTDSTPMQPKKVNKMKGPNMNILSDLVPPPAPLTVNPSITSTTSTTNITRDGSLDYTQFKTQETTATANVGTDKIIGIKKPVRITEKTSTTTKTTVAPEKV